MYKTFCMKGFTVENIVKYPNLTIFSTVNLFMQKCKYCADIVLNLLFKTVSSIFINVRVSMIPNSIIQELSKIQKEFIWKTSNPKNSILISFKSKTIFGKIYIFYHVELLWIQTYVFFNIKS